MCTCVYCLPMYDYIYLNYLPLCLFALWFFVQTFYREIEDSDSITLGCFFFYQYLLFHILEVRLHVDFYVFNQYMYIKI